MPVSCINWALFILTKEITMNKLTNWRWWMVMPIAIFLLPAVFTLFILSCMLFVVEWMADKLADLLYIISKKLKQFVKKGG